MNWLSVSTYKRGNFTPTIPTSFREKATIRILVVIMMVASDSKHFVYLRMRPTCLPHAKL